MMERRPCPYDTNGDGDCGRRLCPFCGDQPRPARVRLSRRKGARKRPDVVVVSRPTKWGNPIRMDDDREAAAEWFGVMLDMRRAGTLPEGHSGWSYPSDDEIRAELAGKDLACWCHLNASCHADELLRIANAVTADP